MQRLENKMMLACMKNYGKEKNYLYVYKLFVCVYYKKI